MRSDVCDTQAVAKIFEENSIDYVVNFAAESHVDRSISHPDIFFKTNVLGTLNLLNQAKSAWQIGEDQYRAGVKFLQISTDEVYGSLGAAGSFSEQTPLNPHSPYSASKASADLLVQAYMDTYRLPVNIIRSSNNFGPYQFPEKLIPLMIHRALHHEKLPVYGDGMQIRDWLYVEDHCKAIDLVISSGQTGEIYNVGGRNERPNLSIVQTIIDFIKKHADDSVSEQLIEFVADRKGHDRQYSVDPKKIESSLGWRPETTFDEGIQKTLRWYLDHQDWLDQVTAASIHREYIY